MAHKLRTLIFGFFILLALPLRAADMAGTVELVEGKVWIQGADNKMRVIQVEQVVYAGDTIITGADGELQVRMKDDAFIAVRANSKLKIDAYRAEGDADDKATFSLLLGTFRSVTGWIGKYNRDNYSVNTRTATIGVRGTDHEPMYIPPAVPGMPAIGEPGVYDKVNNGRIVVKNEFGETEFDMGQAAYVGLNARQAAIKLKGVPDFFKPTRNEKRIEAMREKLQPLIEQNLMKRQQNRKDDKPGVQRPLLKPQSQGQGFLPPAAKREEKNNSEDTLLPSKRPMPVLRELPAAPAPILKSPAIQQPSVLLPDSKMQNDPAPVNKIITPQTIMLPEPVKPIAPVSAPAVMETPIVKPIAIQPAPILSKPAVTTIEQEKTATQEEEQTKSVTTTSPVLIQPAPTKLLMPTR